MKDFLDSFSGYEDLPLHGVKLPEFHIDDKYYDELNLDKNSTDNFSFLKQLVFQGFKNKNIALKQNKDLYIERGRRELEVFNELGFVDYLLLVWYVIRSSHEMGITTGISRGSCGGSLVLYLIGITGIDPLKYNLYFERFVSKVRAKSTIVDGIKYLDGSLLMDIDTDFDFNRRDDVLKFINEKFNGKSAKVLTVNTLKGKLVIKECAKILGNYSESEANYISGFIERNAGFVDHLNEALEKNEDFQNWCILPREEYRFANNKTIFDVAERLEGLPKNFGVHASAMAVSHDNINDLMPTQLTKEGDIISGFTKKDVESMCVKLDVLGLKCVSTLKTMCELTNTKLEDIDIDSSEIYKFLVNCGDKLYGIFQLEADTASRATQKIKPENIDDVSAITSLARPGALMYIDEYAQRKNEGKEVISWHPILDKILKPTKGIIVFQEQLMRITHELFEFSLEDAETVRRIVGKKILSEIEPWKKKIYQRGEEKNFDIKLVDYFWTSLEAAAKYSFNASHAYAYSILSMYCVYFKMKHPKEFFLAYLNMAKHNSDPQSELSRIQVEMDYFGIKLKRPDLSKSGADFSLEDDGIRFGLNSIKGINDKTMESLLKFRGEKFENKFDLFDAAKNCGLNIGALSALIQAGTIDSCSTYENRRSYAVLEAQVWNKLTDREKTYIKKYCHLYNYDLMAMIKDFKNTQKVDDSGKKPIIKESRYDTIRNNCSKYLEIYGLNSRSEELANWVFERKLLGFSYSNSLYSIMKTSNTNLMSFSHIINNISDKERSCLVGIVTDYNDSKSKNGKSMLKLFLEDNGEKITCIFFGDNYDAWKLSRRQEETKIEKDSIVFILGSKKGDVIFVNKMDILDQKIYMKFSEISS